MLATILAAVAIWVSIWLYRRQRTRKSLAYEVKITELVSVHHAAKGRIRIFFGEEQIQRAHLVEARIESNGNVPVVKEDFQEPITFDLGPGATALTVDITDTTPEDMRVQALLQDNEVRLQPLLLNPGDRVILKIFARDLGEVTCHYRIIGVSKMGNAAAQRQRQGQGARLRRYIARSLDGTLSLAVVSVGIAAGLVGVAGTLITGEKETETQVELKSGQELCGHVLHTGDQRIVLQLADTGKIRPLKLSEVENIHEDAC